MVRPKAAFYHQSVTFGPRFKVVTCESDVRGVEHAPRDASRHKQPIQRREQRHRSRLHTDSSISHPDRAPTRSGFIPVVLNIQILRGIAAALVIWVHAQELIVRDVLPHSIKQFGYGGVDLFFVISGFIMVHITKNRNINIFELMKKRIYRIAALYYLFTLAALSAILLKGLDNGPMVDIGDTIRSLTFIPFEKEDGRLYPIYYLGWTLNYEMFFYSIFGVSLLFHKHIRVAFISIILIILSIVGIFIENLSDHGVLAFFYTRPIVLDFVVGMLIAVCVPVPGRSSNAVPWWGCLAVGTAWFVFGGEFFVIGSIPVAPPTDTFFRFGVPSGLIVAGAAGLERSQTRIGTALMQRAGDASYSIYLSHYFFVASVIAVVDQLALGDPLRLLLAPITTMLSIAVGFCTYHLLERPLAGDLGIYRRFWRHGRATVKSKEERISDG
ncbi:MAG: acyltransferase [Mesorhizobium sp.]|nr:MAG: acyltransferase [Mesorhizobium sp.]